MKPLLAAVAVAVVVAASTVHAEDRVLGLLTLADVFGSGPCDKFKPGDIALYGSPQSGAIIGSIRVDRYWTFLSDGGCEGLSVGVHRRGQAAQPLPSEEYAYEAQAAIVLERRGRWFKIRLTDGSAWVQAPATSEFLSLEQLLAQGLTYLTSDWDGRVAVSPGGAATRVDVPPDSNPEVHVLKSQQSDGRLWLHVEVLNHPGCDAPAQPAVVGRGWVPAHARSGAPLVWIASRGC